MAESPLAEWLRFYRDIGVDTLTACPPSRNSAGTSLQELHARIRSCTRCDLHRSRRLAVPGEGASRPGVMFIGEGPGEQEDRTGKPFVGKAGQLLDRLIQRMGLSRETVFIGNIIKCRPPGNRDPQDDEVRQCLPYLKQQIALLSPRVIVCLGRVAVNRLLGGDAPISRLRGRVLDLDGIPVVPTYHPSYILHQRGREAVSRAKWDVWEDMQAVIKLLKN